MHAHTSSDADPAHGDGTGPWYLQGIWPMVIAIPALTVIAGLTTVVIANYKADPLIEAPRRPDIVAMHVDPIPDGAARSLGLGADLTLAGDRLRIDLRGSRAPVPAVLSVVFAHAAKETYDQTADARLAASGQYEAAAPTLPSGRWYVEISPPGRPWRLVGELDGTAGAVQLAPFSAQ